MQTGVLASYREKFILLKEKALSDEQFILYEFCIHQADFDEKHKETYGTFQMTNKEIGEGIGWLEDKVGRNIRKLLQKNLLHKIGKRIVVNDFFRFSIKCAFERTQNKQELAYMQEIVAKLRLQNAEMRVKTADLRKKEPEIASSYTPISDRFPYKVNSVIQRTFEDYKKIKEEGGYTMLDEGDMKWIDENVTETIL